MSGEKSGKDAYDHVPVDGLTFKPFHVCASRPKSMVAACARSVFVSPPTHRCIVYGDGHARMGPSAHGATCAFNDPI